jgi:dUTP pyrophosphatase
MNINVKLFEDKFVPIRAHESDAGADLKVRITTHLPKLTRVLVPTGVHVEIPYGYVGFLVPRSSLSKNDIIMANSIGVIDADYRGELMVPLVYIGTNEFGTTVEENVRIAQLLVMPVALPKFIRVNELSDTVRGEGGFGSTGTK